MVGLPRSWIRTWGKFKSAQIVLVQPIIAYNHLTDADDTTCRRLPSFAAISWQMLATSIGYFNIFEDVSYNK